MLRTTGPEELSTGSKGFVGLRCPALSPLLPPSEITTPSSAAGARRSSDRTSVSSASAPEGGFQASAERRRGVTGCPKIAGRVRGYDANPSRLRFPLLAPLVSKSRLSPEAVAAARRCGGRSGRAPNHLG